MHDQDDGDDDDDDGDGVDGWMDGWMDERVDRQTDGWPKRQHPKKKAFPENKVPAATGRDSQNAFVLNINTNASARKLSLRQRGKG